MGWVVGNYITLGIVIVFAVIMLLYLKAEKANDGKNGFWKAMRLKLCLSAMFCAVSIISYVILINYSHSPNLFFALKFLMVLALFAALCGNFFLQYIRLDVKKYKIGIYCFTVTQILLLIPMCILNGIGWKELAIAVAVVLGIRLLVKKQGWQLGELKKPLVVNTVLLTFMASKAFINMMADMTVGSVLLAVGAALLLVSHILLGLWNYHTNKMTHAYWNWIAYFSGMMLIALSISPEFSTSLIY